MSEDLNKFNSGNIKDVVKRNRDMTEKALHMRCISYLAHVKESLLVETILEIDHSKKNLAQINKDIRQQNQIIQEQKKELEEKNTQLEQLKQELENRVKHRTAQLERTYLDLKEEMEQRRKVENEKERYRRQFLQAQKMESIGRVAGGVAHDFNNLLTAILGYSQLLLNKLPKDHPLVNGLNIIFEAGDKAAALTRQLLILSRKQPMEMKVVNLNHTVENMSNILRRLLREDMEIELHLTPEPVNITADVSQLEQVLLNLAINARDAMPGGGKLTIETSTVQLSAQFPEFQNNLKPGNYIMLAVTDNGEGMPPEVQKNIFEPFFTTKPKDKGTGLGLATVQGVIDQHQGHITVYSEVGTGTTFKIYFPSTAKEVKKVKAPPPVSKLQGSEHILVVDDQLPIRLLVKETLTPLGYTVQTAQSGREALELATNTQHPFDLLITDIIMPHMKGNELKDLMAEKSPNTKVIMISGYTDHILAKSGVVKPDTTFISKPFSPTQLAEQVRKTLDQST